MLHIFFILRIPQPPISTLFPYTTLFRSSVNFEEFVKDGTKVRESLSRKIISNYLVNYRIPKYTYKSSFNFVEYAQSIDRKSTRLNSSHVRISYAVFCLKKKKKLTHSSKH